MKKLFIVCLLLSVRAQADGCAFLPSLNMGSEVMPGYVQVQMDDHAQKYAVLKKAKQPHYITLNGVPGLLIKLSGEAKNFQLKNGSFLRVSTIEECEAQK